jgi:predicted ArsR family transcriptional regulator
VLGVFEMVVLIVALVMVSEIVKAVLKYRKGNGNADYERRIARLEERVKSLEAVVSDHGYDLKREFSRLEQG